VQLPPGLTVSERTVGTGPVTFRSGPGDATVVTIALVIWAFGYRTLCVPGLGILSVSVDHREELWAA